MIKSKKIIVFILTIVLMFATFLTGCTINVEGEGKGIVSITKTDTVGLVDTYTILFTDGTSTTFTVTNGAKGEDGEDGESNVKSIVSITKTDENGLVDTYTILFTDGTSTTFTVTNGANGNDGKPGLTLEDLFEKWLEENPNGTYDEFLKDIIEIESGGSESGGSESDNSTLIVDSSKVINKALLSSLKIYTEFTTTVQLTAYKTQNTIEVGAGSAVIYKITDEYTYIITNYHVVYNAEQNQTSKIAKRITCYLYGSEGGPVDTETKDTDGYPIYDYGFGAIDCEYVGGSATADIALVKTKTSTIKGINEDVEAIKFANDYHVGETAIAIGNPDNDGISVTQGIVSVDNEFINLSVDGVSRSFRSMRIDTPLYHGNSGGGLFNKDGEIIGITNAGDSTDQNINYAIPLDIVKPVVENIYYYNNGSANKITMGVTVQKGDSKYVYDKSTGYGKIVSDVNVIEVAENSIASKIGFKVDDKILTFKVNTIVYELEQYFTIGDVLYNVRAGDVLSFTCLRDGVEITTNTYTVMPADIKKID